MLYSGNVAGAVQRFKRKNYAASRRQGNDTSVHITATAVEVTPNAQGRVIIPQALREFAQIEGEALVIGMNNRVEIWNKAKFEEFTAAHQDTLTEAVSMLRF